MIFILNMDERLKEAARCGNIDSLYELVQENPSLLDHIDEKPFSTTPLHVAAFAGQTQFAKEIMRLKPSFAKKLNVDGFSPMHLALQNGQTELVLQFLQVDNDLVCVKGREGMTPLHCAAKAGKIDLLVSFLNACPKSIEDVTIRNETTLHVALNSGMFQAFEVLVRCLKQRCRMEDHYRERKVLNWKDEEGNTVLHIAASKNKPEALKTLLDCRVDVKLKNQQGLTALDLINGQAQSGNAEIIDMIGRSEALTASLFPAVDCFGYYVRQDQWLRSAAQNGDVDALYAIIQEDPYILDHIDQVPFDDTPLHVAASAGHTQFALEIMGLKPSFARKLNREGSSPMYLALQNDELSTMRRLLDVDENLVRVKGRKGLTPLHYAAEKGKLEQLVELLMACPRSIEDLTVHKESALHIAAKNDQREALVLLVNWLELVDQNKVLDWPDDEGNTVLHIASQRNQIQVSACSFWFLL
uniref:Ankyrin-3-like n=1 Tax=Rhizophora mucronata TaxID=61149 RepID=A0A2P2ITA6_RHIMU